MKRDYFPRKIEHQGDGRFRSLKRTVGQLFTSLSQTSYLWEEEEFSYLGPHGK